MELGLFGVKTFWDLGRFAAGTLCGWDVLGLGPYVMGRFVFGTFLGRFVGAPLNAYSQKTCENLFCCLPEL